MSRTSPEVSETVVIIGGLVSNKCNITPAAECHKGICATLRTGTIILDWGIRLCYTMRNVCMPYPDNRVSLGHNPRPGPHQSHHILM